MVLATAAVTALAWWDEQREDRAALGDLGREQSVVASILAGGLRVRLSRPGKSDVETGAAELLQQAAAIETRGELAVFIIPPAGRELYATDGHAVESPLLREASDRDVSIATLTRAEAASLGLIERTAVAGFAHVASPAGRWGIVAVSTAASERDRQRRARARLVLGVLVATGLVFAFGGLALRNQRKELDLEKELAVAGIQRERDRKLYEAQRVAAMGTFAMGIVHEVSTPLGVIVGRAEQLLARFRADEKAARAAEAIIQQADRIQQTVRRFLDLARGGPPTFARTDPADVVRSAASAIEHRFSKAHVTLSIDVRSSTPAISCDRVLLEHAIVNLLLNALEACEAGGHVEAAVRADDPHVHFVVTDDGAGIHPEHASRVVEPFFTTKPAGKGTGLGLAIATEVAKEHHGTLAIAPHAPRGTRATISVPALGQDGTLGS